MSQSLVKSDNILVWDGVQTPFLEGYTLKIYDNQAQWSLALLFGFCTSSQKNPDGLASLVGIFSHLDYKPLLFTQNFNLQKNEIIHHDSFIQLGSSHLSLADCEGFLENKKQILKWHVFFEDPVKSARMTPWFLRKSFKHFEPRLLNHASGTLIVNHHELAVQHTKCYQSHFFGKTHPHFWQLAHCHQFREDKNAFCQIMTTTYGAAKLGGQVHTACVFFAEKLFKADSLLKALLSNQSESDFERWFFSFKKSGYRFDITVKRQRQNTLEIPYDGPDLQKKFLYTSHNAAMKIKIYKKKSRQWQHHKTLSTPHQATFETVSAEKVSDAPKLFSSHTRAK